MSTGRQKKLAIIIVVVIALAWLGVGAAMLGYWLDGGQQPEVSDQGSNVVISQKEADLVGLVEKTSPTVVSIVTSQVSGQGFFQQEVEGAGTGIVISEDGYILTNKHVISEARSVQVVMSDGTRHSDVTVVGSDPLNDIAFLKIKNVSDLKVATLGDSGAMRVGQDVIAIGNSLGQYQNTVTSGIVSGLGRPVTAASSELNSRVESLTDLLQTDAAINPGNSGGPLINSAGQVVGINTAIAADAQGIGFAIPINAAKGMIRGVIANGKVEKAYLGVQYVAITPDVRTEYKLSVDQGALVRSGSGSAVESNSPADEAGIKDGDIITKVNEKSVGNQGGLGSLVAEFMPGEKITLTIIRDGKEQQKTLTLGAYKSQSQTVIVGSFVSKAALRCGFYY